MTHMEFNLEARRILSSRKEGETLAVWVSPPARAMVLDALFTSLFVWLAVLSYQEGSDMVFLWGAAVILSGLTLYTSLPWVVHVKVGFQGLPLSPKGEVMTLESFTKGRDDVPPQAILNAISAS